MPLLLAALLAAPASPSMPAAEEGWLATPDGTRIFYKKVGRGPAAAVFVHGGPGADFRAAEAAIAPLADGRAIVFYDQRGSGLSGIVTDAALLTAEHHVRDLEAVRARFRLRRMAVIAQSWGAVVAALYAKAHPDRVARLLLLSPMAPAKAMASGVAPEAAADPAAERDVPPAALANRETVRAAALTSLGDWELRPMLEGIAAPTLVIDGAKSDVVESARAWAEEMPAARLLLIPNVESAAEAPEIFLAAAKRFLAGRFPSEAELVGESDAH